MDDNGVIFFFQVTKAKDHKYNFGSLVSSLNLLCSTNGSAEVHYCVLIPQQNKDTFKINPSKIEKANLITPYDSGWTRKLSIPQDTLVNDNSNFTWSSNVKKKKSKQKNLDYRNATRISLWYDKA